MHLVVSSFPDAGWCTGAGSSMCGRVEPHAETPFRWAQEAAERQYPTEINKDRPSDPTVKAIEGETSADGHEQSFTDMAQISAKPPFACKESLQ